MVGAVVGPHRRRGTQAQSVPAGRKWEVDGKQLGRGAFPVFPTDPAHL